MEENDEYYDEYVPEDEYDYETENIIEEDVEYKDERDIYDRVSFLANEMLGEYTDPQNLRDPVQKLIAFVKIIALELKQCHIDISTNDISTIIDFIPNIVKPETKNPTGIILGFWVVDNKTSINIEKLNSLKTKIKKLKYTIKLHDVIRYARYWILHIYSKIEKQN
jgi:hypothetical protein